MLIHPPLITGVHHSMQQLQTQNDFTHPRDIDPDTLKVNWEVDFSAFPHWYHREEALVGSVTCEIWFQSRGCVTVEGDFKIWKASWWVFQSCPLYNFPIACNLVPVLAMPTRLSSKSSDTSFIMSPRRGAERSTVLIAHYLTKLISSKELSN